MSRHELEQFRARARRVTLPESVRASVLDEAATKRDERARGSRQARRERQVVTRRSFVRAGAVAAGSVAVLLGASVLARNAGSSGDNWFALTAYAEGVDEGGDTRLALGRLFSGTLGWSGGPESEFLMVNTVLDLTCTGSNVKTLTYALEGENVLTEQGLRMERDLASTQGVWIYWPGGSAKSYTVSYEDQVRADSLSAGYRVYANAPLSDEMRELLAQMQELHDALGTGEEPSDEQLRKSAELSNQGSVLALGVLAAELEQVALVMTARFADGSTQTKRYAFSPREGYAQTYASYLDDMAFADPEPAEELRTDPPSLFYLTETSA